MRINSFGYNIKECFKNLWRNRMMSVASISSVAATLVILGIIFVLIVNISAMTQVAKDQFDTIQVYLDDDLAIDGIEEIGTKMIQLQGVQDVIFEAKEEALEKMKLDWDQNGYLLDGLESNPLPNSYIIVLDDINYANYIVNTIQDYDGIEEVKYYQEVIENIIKITDVIRKVGLMIMVILIAISTFIISNTIKIAVHSRRREINIMKYVGATNWFIRGPFLLEGVVLGLLGAILSSVVIYFAYKYSYDAIMEQFYMFISAYLIRAQVIIKDVVFLFVIIGSGIGALGSLASLRKYLDV
ncbi:MAG: ABC transporter permease [Clostridia bacterium]|nr:ABC transporter permease [Clostridia bacterium]